MEDIKQYVINFVEGKVPPKEFIKNCESDSTIFNWIQSIVPLGKTCYKHTLVEEVLESESKNTRCIEEIVPYDIRIVWKNLVYNNLDKKYVGLGDILNIHGELTKLIKEVFPNEKIKEDKTIENKFNFLLVACPEYIGGIEVEENGILEKLIEELPSNLSKMNKMKLFKAEVRKLFHIEKNRYPRWLQEPDWPLSKSGKPMKFVGQEKKSNDRGYEYIFEDTDTEEIRRIEQFM